MWLCVFPYFLTPDPCEHARKNYPDIAPSAKVCLASIFVWGKVQYHIIYIGYHKLQIVQTQVIILLCIDIIAPFHDT